ncbi:stage II sporulation protein M [Scopulibacillus darangshiensis]|uniref:Stage II sporulation protein M n=1 Tax=Scopulibacillus darangshiensis TaxID=442528 RepID=A0A4V2SNM4_9BACL|nr:stage II sporulation protein M [Scopulibacillus darangshiensis]TCP31736.1 stage II sporulation protein M [Scopulibacillus darangshiensis]
MNQNIKRVVTNHIQENLSIYTFVCSLFFMGIIFGAIVVNSLPYEAKQHLVEYLNRFFGELSDGKIAVPSAMLGESFKHYVQYVGFMWVLGLSVIGLPVIFILLFLKGVVIGFTVGFLVNQMGFHGFWVAMASVFPQNLIVIPIFIIMGVASVAFSLKMFRQLLMKTRKTPLLPQFSRYAMLLLAVSAALFIVSLYEAYLSPGLIRSIIN